MSSDARAVIERLMAAFNARGVDGAIEYFHPEVRWYGEFLDGEPYVGHEGVREMATLFTGAFDDFRMELDRLIELDGRALALAHQTGRTRAGGLLTDHMAIAFAFRDGLVSEVRWFNSWEEGLKATGVETGGG